MVRKMGGFGKIGGFMILALTLLPAGAAWAQQDQQIPDAPSATRPVPPPALPSPRPSPDETQPPPKPDEPRPAAPQENAPPRSAPDRTEKKALPPDQTEQKSPPPPMPVIKTVPEGSVPRDSETRDDLYTVSKTVNFVLVPVMVKDTDGRLVNGLSPKDFWVLENGQKQPLKFFTSDPFLLSAAVVLDLGMPDVGVKKVQDTLSALQGAFSPWDEVGIYTYSSSAGRVSDFAAAGQQLTAVLNQIKTYSGANSGVPVTSGPLGPQGPMINNHPLDSPVPRVSTPAKTPRVLNDAILLAARDLAKRDRARRKIIFVISDGREYRSTASYADTLKVLLTQNIIVYAVGVEGAAIPGYGTLQKIHLPKTGRLIGYSNVLPKYVSATGGGTVYSEYAPADIERAYARAIGDARNQYTLGYAGKPGAGGYRQIEVRVRRPDVKVYAKDGYYPLPAAK
jgi:VWFA-related protein